MVEKKYPYFPLYPQDFISSYKCQRMSLDAFGAFNWLLYHSWVYSEKPCHLPNDPNELAWLLHIDIEKFNGIWDQIKNKFLTTKCKKYIFNKRLFDEYIKMLERSKSMRNNALQRSKSKTIVEQKQSNGSATAEQTEVEDEYENEVKDKTKNKRSKIAVSIQSAGTIQDIPWSFWQKLVNKFGQEKAARILYRAKSADAKNIIAYISKGLKSNNGDVGYIHKACKDEDNNSRYVKGWIEGMLIKIYPSLKEENRAEERGLKIIGE